LQEFKAEAMARTKQFSQDLTKSFKVVIGDLLPDLAQLLLVDFVHLQLLHMMQDLFSLSPLLASNPRYTHLDPQSTHRHLQMMQDLFSAP
jgi:hypothetical protein